MPDTSMIPSFSRPSTQDTQPSPLVQPDLELAGPGAPSTDRVNATFVTLARNTDVWEIAKSIRSIEDRFNRNHNYDWVFLNDQDFDADFKKLTSSLVSGTTHYGKIPKEHWGYPDWIDRDKAAKAREEMGRKKIIYGDSESYRHMCRFESGFFFLHPLMQNYEFYWRVEPSIELFCDVPIDPFRLMKENDKKYSFVISLYEYIETIPSLWDSVKKFMVDHPEHVADDNAMDFLSDDGGVTYNKCHFVSCLFSRHEKQRLNLFRSGPTLKSPAWTGCGPRPIWTTSRPWIATADSSTKDGATRQSTPSPPACCCRKSKSTSSTRLPTTTSRSPTAQPVSKQGWT